MPDPTNDHDIDALAAFLMRVRDGDDPWADPDHAKDWSRALTALVAERDALRSELAGANIARAALAVRIGKLESQWLTLPHDPFRDAAIDLRERLVCAALTGLCADPNMNVLDTACVAVEIADATLAAMRKGVARE